MSQPSHSQKPLPALGTDHVASDHINDFFNRELTEYRQTLLNLLQGLDADKAEATNVDWYPKENPLQMETEPSSTQQEIMKTKEKGKEKEKGNFPDHSSFPMLEYLQRLTSYERFDFEPIRDPEMVEEVGLDCSRIYTRSFLDWNYGNACDATNSNAIAGPSRVTLDDLERLTVDKHM